MKQFIRQHQSIIKNVLYKFLNLSRANDCNTHAIAGTMQVCFSNQFESHLHSYSLYSSFHCSQAEGQDGSVYVYIHRGSTRSSVHYGHLKWYDWCTRRQKTWSTQTSLFCQATIRRYNRLIILWSSCYSNLIANQIANSMTDRNGSM